MTTGVQHSTFSIEKGYKAPPEKVFAAFADEDKKRRWFAEGPGFNVDSYELDFRVGGWERSRFRFVADKPIEEGTPCGNDTVFLHIEENRRIIFAYTMTLAGRPFSSSQVTVDILRDGTGSRLVHTEQVAFMEGSDGPEMREHGTRELLAQLARELGEDDVPA